MKHFICWIEMCTRRFFRRNLFKILGMSCFILKRENSKYRKIDSIYLRDYMQRHLTTGFEVYQFSSRNDVHSFKLSSNKICLKYISGSDIIFFIVFSTGFGEENGCGTFWSNCCFAEASRVSFVISVAIEGWHQFGLIIWFYANKT